MVLGLLQAGPRHGYELHRIVMAHGTLYADFKKPTLYHLLHRLKLRGMVQVRTEQGARGRRGERLIFAVTPAGTAEFRELLRTILGSCDADQAGFEMATAYLTWLPAREGQLLLRRRRRAVVARRAEILADLAHMAAEPDGPRLAARSLAADHALTLMNAELVWMDRVISHLGAPGGRTTKLTPVVLPVRRQAGSRK